jgi:hypothetical protein
MKPMLLLAQVAGSMSSSMSLALAPVDRHPGVGTGEFAHLVGHRHAADAGADDDDVGHVVISS